MGINTGVRKVWLFKCQNSENGQFIYFLYLKKGGLYLAALKRGYSGAHPYYVKHRELPPRMSQGAIKSYANGRLTMPP